MQLKYIILTAAFSVAATGAFAQNIPILTQTAPVGTVAPAPSFSETVGATDLNVIKTFVPILPTTDAATVNENSPANAVKQQVVYVDGTNQVYQSISKNVATVDGVWDRANRGVGGLVAAYKNYGNVANLDGIPYVEGAVDQGKKERWSKSASTKGNYGECIE
jgi:hypothetical protein